MDFHIKTNPNEISTDPTHLTQAASGTLQVHSLLVAGGEGGPHGTRLQGKRLCLDAQRLNSFKEPPLTTEINMM